MTNDSFGLLIKKMQSKIAEMPFFMNRLAKNKV